MTKHINTKKIVLVSPFAAPLLFGGYEGEAGGAERQMVLIANKLSEYDTAVGFCCKPFDVSTPRDNPKIRIFRNSFRYLGGSKLYWIIDGIGLMAGLAKVRPHWIIVRNGGPMLIFWVLFYKLFSHARFLFTVQSDKDIDPGLNRTGKSRFFYRVFRFMIRRADHLVCQHARQQQLIAEHFGRKADIQPNLSSPLWPADPAIKRNKKEILWPGNTNDNKRFLIIPELAKLLPDYTFVVAVNNSDPVKFRRIAEQSAKQANIRFLGTVRPRKSEALYYTASLVLNTSLVEGFPNTFLQAWSAGIPVVTAGVDPSGIIERFSLGSVVSVPAGYKPEDIASLAAAISALTRDNERYQTCCRNAGKYLDEFHNDRKIIARLAEILGIN